MMILKLISKIIYSGYPNKLFEVSVVWPFTFKIRRISSHWKHIFQDVVDIWRWEHFSKIGKGGEFDHCLNFLSSHIKETGKKEKPWWTVLFAWIAINKHIKYVGLCKYLEGIFILLSEGLFEPTWWSEFSSWLLVFFSITAYLPWVNKAVHFESI